MVVEVGGKSEVVDLSHLDFQHEPPCESLSGCSKAADAMVVTRCCGATRCLCQKHLDVARGFFLRQVLPRCVLCHSIVVEFHEVRPLR